MKNFKIDVSEEDMQKIKPGTTVVLEDRNGGTRALRERSWLEVVTPYVLFVLMVWAVPMTKTVVDNHYELKKGPRFTQFEGQKLGNRLHIVEDKVKNLPPTNLLRDVSELKSEVKKLNSLVTRLEVIIENNNNNHSR